MKVSIAMATYNGAKYIQEQLDSFVEQYRQPDELVVCDDASSDETLNILRNFQENAPFEVRVYRNDVNLGYIKNFDKALSLCTGDIVFLSDQDDVWLPDKLNVMEEVFSDNPKAMVVINDQVITEADLTPTEFTVLGNIEAMGLNDSWHSAGGCMAICRPFLDILLPVPSYAHGHDGWISSLANALDVCLVCRVPLQYYRRHEENTSESLAARSVKMNPLDFHAAYGLRDVSEGWERQIRLYEDYRRRLEEREAEIKALDLVVERDAAIERITFRVDALMKRMSLVSMPRRLRLMELLKFWWSGGYKPFSGFKSAIKDILR